MGPVEYFRARAAKKSASQQILQALDGCQPLQFRGQQHTPATLADVLVKRAWPRCYGVLAGKSNVAAGLRPHNVSVALTILSQHLTHHGDDDHDDDNLDDFDAAMAARILGVLGTLLDQALALKSTGALNILDLELLEQGAKIHVVFRGLPYDPFLPFLPQYEAKAR